MRIRKNAKLSSISLSASSHASPPEALQTHVCQLNQSPWDVIVFSQESFQFEGEDSFTGNVSLGDSIGAVESVASMMDVEDKTTVFKVDGMVIDDNDMEVPDKMFDDNEHLQIGDDFSFDQEDKPLYCIKTDGKGWHCRNEPRNGHNLCDHHLSLLKSYNTTSVTNPLKKPDKGIAPGARRGRARTAKKGSSSASNPYEFYYYSGFGPLWGKRRGERPREEKKQAEVKETDNNYYPNEKTTPSSSSLIDNGGFDYVDDEDDEEEENGDSTVKKRMRKPVKARSLKSLM